MHRVSPEGSEASLIGMYESSAQTVNISLEGTKEASEKNLIYALFICLISIWGILS